MNGLRQWYASAAASPSTPQSRESAVYNGRGCRIQTGVVPVVVAPGVQIAKLCLMRALQNAHQNRVKTNNSRVRARD